MDRITIHSDAKTFTIQPTVEAPPVKIPLWLIGVAGGAIALLAIYLLTRKEVKKLILSKSY
ncbi:MAG: hypothetical protein QXZ14_12070 [Candidatus Jordarchaeales archaeon]